MNNMPKLEGPDNANAKGFWSRESVGARSARPAGFTLLELLVVMVIIGLLAGFVALGLCLRASFRASPPRASRAAVTFSLLPFAIGICAALVGLGLWLAGVMPNVAQLDAALNLGKACLAGLVTTAVPLAWALTLVRLRRATP